MKRSTLIKLHIVASAIAVITICTFFITSLTAEIIGDESVIKSVKTGILYALPLLLISMPFLAFSGKKLAGQSKHPGVVQKANRMKFIMINGVILVSLVVFLYYRANYVSIDGVFLTAQIAEFIFGLSNLTLIGLNIKAGLEISGRNKRV